MTRLGSVLALALAVGLVCESAALAAKPKYGVFATIDGKKFKAPATTNLHDTCVSATYEMSGGIILGAIECKGGHHRRPKKNLKFVHLVCGIIDPAKQPGVPPFETNCIVADYGETKTRHGIPITMKEWVSVIELDPTTLTETSGVRVRIDAFDGTTVRGAFFGTYDMPQQPGSPTSVSISGEGTFFLPATSAP
jgi:hypothetical protein